MAISNREEPVPWFATRTAAAASSPSSAHDSVRPSPSSIVLDRNLGPPARRATTAHIAQSRAGAVVPIGRYGRA